MRCSPAPRRRAATSPSASSWPRLSSPPSWAGAPARSFPAFLLAAAVLLLPRFDVEPLRGVGLLAGPLVVLGWLALRGRAPLGYSGSMALGAVTGVWIVGLS